MDLIINIFNLILYQPLFNALILLYEYLPGHDFGVAVIILTIIIRIILYPLMTQSIRSQKILTELQPRIQEIQKKYKDDKAQQGRAMMELYQKEKFNPFGGCFPLLAQFPILIALYQLFWKGLRVEQTTLLYSFVPNPGAINSTFLGIIDLARSATVKIDNITHFLWPNIILIILVGIIQFIQTKMSYPKTRNIKKDGSQMFQFSGMMQKQMLYFFPVFTIFILWNLPSALGLYWLVTTLFSIAQQYLIYRKPIYAQPK